MSTSTPSMMVYRYTCSRCGKGYYSAYLDDRQVSPCDRCKFEGGRLLAIDRVADTLAKIQGFESMDGRTRLSSSEASQLRDYQREQEASQREFEQYLKQKAYSESLSFLATLKTTTVYDQSSSGDLSSMQAKATQIATLGGQSDARDTVAVALGKDGKLYGAAQRNWMERKKHGLLQGVLLIDDSATPDYVHAEMWLLYVQWLLAQGYVKSVTVGDGKESIRSIEIVSITANRAVCANCAAVLKAAGVTFDPEFTQPVTDNWVDPWEQGQLRVQNPYTHKSSQLVLSKGMSD